ncbi:MAG: 50S ribosomal protein L2 [Candidatus Marsarchaeota archaeon]|nr:50S ribosomal protein L2 [Candidatus Marsarchaeota archaeon]
MGKPILGQRKGRGTSTFISPTWKRVASACYPPASHATSQYTVSSIIHDPGRGVPLAKLDSGERVFYTVAADGIHVGQRIQVGNDATPGNGCILPLSNIPDGSKVFNVELRPGDGGNMARTSGAYCTVISHTEGGAILTLPSGKTKTVSGECRATIGVAAAGGRTEKPFLKAGSKYHLSKPKPWKYPAVRGIAMNTVSHPHGGGNHPSVSRSTSISRNAPPGRKVGHIAARRAGRT